MILTLNIFNLVTVTKYNYNFCIFVTLALVQRTFLQQNSMGSCLLQDAFQVNFELHRGLSGTLDFGKGGTYSELCFVGGEEGARW